MPNHPITSSTGPWRILILDRDPADPKRILATVAAPGDVRPARPGGWPVPSRAHTVARCPRVAHR